MFSDFPAMTIPCQVLHDYPQLYTLYNEEMQWDGKSQTSHYLQIIISKFLGNLLIFPEDFLF
jgi:hypothetical protein